MVNNLAEGLWQVRTPSRDDLAAFLARQQHLLKLERDEEEEQTRLLNSNCSPRLLEQRGLALGGLGVSAINIGLGGKTLIELHRPLAYHVDSALPPHTFRNGDTVRIEEHQSSSGTTKLKSKGKKDGDEDTGVEGVVYRVGPEKVVVAVDEGKDVDLPERLRLLKLANSVTFDRMRKTLEHLTRMITPDGEVPNALNWPLVRSLVGLQQPRWSDSALEQSHQGPKGEAGDIQWFGDRLNESQKEAIDFCLRADQVACIHGPPGTGKTHTLIELIFQLLSRPASPETEQPPRILVTTPSNLALDNLLLRLQTLAQQPPYSTLLPRGSILRIGHPTRVHRDLIQDTLDYRAANGDAGELVRDIGREIEGHLGALGKKRGEKGAVKGKERGLKWGEVRELRKEYRQREARVVTSVVGGARVVLATCHSAGVRQLNNEQFDVAIIDEATQGVEAVCWVPILKANKLIVAGDPQQLPPTVISKIATTSKKGEQSTVHTQSEKPVTDGTGMPTAEAAEVDEDQGSADDDAVQTSDENIVDGSPSAHLKKVHITSPEPRITQLKPPRTLETTLFHRLERMYGPGIKRVLRVQYRMNERIAAFPSKTLYHNELISDPSVASHTLLDLETISNKDSDDAKDTLEHPVVFFDTAGCEFFERNEANDADGKGRLRLGEGSKSNENEASIVAKWARHLVSLGVPPVEIGVVAPYQAQAALLASLLHEEFPQMTIGTVDGLQGQERDAIILTLVRSNPKGEVGFLGEYRRLNVAMTRPRRQLCVVGDSDTVAKGSSYLKKWMSWLEDNADVRYAGDEV